MTTATPGRRPLALYDGDCGFCTMAAGWIPRLGARVVVSSLQEHDLGALGVDASRTDLEMPVVMPDGRVEYGHRAWAQILAHSPQPWRTLGLVLGSRVMGRPGAALYRLVASNRGRLPGSTAQCGLPQAGAAGASSTASSAPPVSPTSAPGPDTGRG
ncbi:thiol-disulfide oxidoreductase DCC family protein [Serinicoccus sediminis]|uniref:thiol-disulfide oxidoreductase DCC family protein n=1 Tax=Serinicoccus sediminis TaxID=2306021 RepID=UPI0010202043|nr:DCC1-like thiol-disulfide oxidoreductase family protein [Serinicoccus sediminis]